MYVRLNLRKNLDFRAKGPQTVCEVRKSGVFHRNQVAITNL